MRRCSSAVFSAAGLLLCIALATTSDAQLSRTVECKGSPCAITIESLSYSNVRVSQDQTAKTTTIENVKAGTITIADSPKDAKFTLVETVTDASIAIMDKAADGEIKFSKKPDGKILIVAHVKDAKTILVDGAKEGKIIIDEAKYGNITGALNWDREHLCNATAYFRRKCEYVEWKICRQNNGTGDANPGTDGSCPANSTEVGLDFERHPRSFCAVKVDLKKLCGGRDPYPGEVREVAVGYRCSPDEVSDKQGRFVQAQDGEYVYLDCLKKAAEKPSKVQLGARR